MLGGQALDLCQGIAIDSTGSAYVTGTTYSSDFPTQVPFQSALQGTANAFVVKIDPVGTTLIYATFLGGSNMDQGGAIAVDALGSAYVAGATASTDFPISSTAIQTALQGSYNAFVARMAPDGRSLAFSSYLGGSKMDAATAISLDPWGRVVLAGYTSSPDFPTKNAMQMAAQGTIGSFATVIDFSGSSLVFSSYFAGSNDDRAYAVKWVAGNHLYLAGTTASNNFPIAMALEPSLNGNYDGFVLEVNYQVTPPTSLLFVPAPPCRVVDTREGQGKTGAFGPPSLTALSTRDFLIPSSPCAIPSSAQAYSLNFGVLPPGPVGSLFTWPSGQSNPGLPTLDSPHATVAGNAAIVAAGTNGSISVLSSDLTDLIVDLNGYFAPATGSGLAFYPMTPCRVADTRASQGKTGAFGPPSLAAYSSRDIPLLSSSCAIPSAAQAYSVNIAVLPPGPVSFLSAWPTGQPYPGVAMLNSPDGTIRSNAAIVPAGTNGSIRVVSGEPTDLIIDINGYFAAPGAPGALNFYTVTPCRVADTRASQGKTGAFGPPALAAYSSRSFPILAGSCGIPDTAQAYSLNLAVTPPGPVSFLSAWPSGQPYPGVATLNSPDGSMVSRAAFVPAGTNGSVTVVSSDPTDLIIDINGYFAP
jgi:hypothetical protein